MQERRGFDPWVGKIPWRRAWGPTAVFLPGESHTQWSLAGHNPGVMKNRTRLSELARSVMKRTTENEVNGIYSWTWAHLSFRRGVSERGASGSSGVDLVWTFLPQLPSMPHGPFANVFFWEWVMGWLSLNVCASSTFSDPHFPVPQYKATFQARPALVADGYCFYRYLWGWLWGRTPWPGSVLDNLAIWLPCGEFPSVPASFILLEGFWNTLRPHISHFSSSQFY